MQASLKMVGIDRESHEMYNIVKLWLVSSVSTRGTEFLPCLRHNQCALLAWGNCSEALI